MLLHPHSASACSLFYFTRIAAALCLIVYFYDVLCAYCFTVYYIIICFLLNTLSALASVIVLHLHHCYETDAKEHDPHTDAIPLLHTTTTIRTNNTGSTAMLISDYNNDAHSAVHISKLHNRVHPIGDEDTVIGKSSADSLDIAHNVAAIVQWLHKKENKKQRKRRREERWTNVASVVDRVLLVIFLLATVTLTCVCLGLVLTSRSADQ